MVGLYSTLNGSRNAVDPKMSSAQSFRFSSTPLHTPRTNPLLLLVVCSGRYNVVVDAIWPVERSRSISGGTNGTRSVTAVGCPDQFFDMSRLGPSGS